MKPIDLRSDTVTQPTEAMRQAMATAAVGDDVYGEDPTVNRLQEMAAERMGMEAGLFVPSGTMGNLLSVLTVCNRGDEVIMGHLGHTFLYEAGGISALGGVFPNTLINRANGTIALEDIQNAIRPDDIHAPVSRMLIIENTHNRCGGTVLPMDYLRDASALARMHNLHFHLDGARIFNAAAALNQDVKEISRHADSVTFCLSKGLCAPVGSVLCGTKAFIKRSLRFRKMLGGGMRQAGVLAAAGILSLETMTQRLKEDHRRAAELASGLAAIPGVEFEMGMPQTNMVFPSITSEIKFTAKEIASRLAEEGVRVGVVAQRRFRLVVHYWVDDTDIKATVQAFQKVLQASLTV